jgi:hypothetical protein
MDSNRLVRKKRERNVKTKYASARIASVILWTQLEKLAGLEGGESSSQIRGLEGVYRVQEKRFNV